MSTLFRLFPFLLKLYAASGYHGPKFKEGLHHACTQIYVKIVKRSDIGKLSRRATQTMDRGANDCVAQLVSLFGQGLGVPEPEWFEAPTLGLDPADVQNALSKRHMIPDRL